MVFLESPFRMSFFDFYCNLSQYDAHCNINHHHHHHHHPYFNWHLRFTNDYLSWFFIELLVQLDYLPTVINSMWKIPPENRSEEEIYTPRKKTFNKNGKQPFDYKKSSYNLAKDSIRSFVELWYKKKH